MPTPATTLPRFVAGMALSSLAVAGDVPPALVGALVFEDTGDHYIALDNAVDGPIHIIRQSRGTPGAPYWRDDGLRVLAWRGDIAHVRMPLAGSSATITNALGHCLTVRAADDIRWSECRGGASNQVWMVSGATLVAPPPFLGFLAYGTQQDDARLHIVGGDAPLTLVTSVLSAMD